MKRRTALAFGLIAAALAAYFLVAPRRPVRETDATTAPPAEFREVWFFDPPFAATGPAWLGRDHFAVRHPDRTHAVLFALDRRTAKSAWSFDNNRTLPPFPAATGVDPLLVPAGRSLVALSAADSTPVWSLPVADRVTASPARTGVFGRAAVPAGTDGVYLIDARTGSLIWHTSGIGEVTAPPAAAGGRLFVGTATELVALDDATGAVAWRSKLPGLRADRPVWAGNGIVAVPVGDGVACFDAETGRQKWFVPDDAGPVEFAPELVTLSSPAWTRSLLYVGSAGGVVRAIDVDAGRVVWAARVGGRVVGPPRHAWLYVFAVTEDGRVVVLDHTTGAAVGQYRLPGGGPVLAADAGPRTVVVAEADTPRGRRVRVLGYEYVKWFTRGPAE